MAAVVGNKEQLSIHCDAKRRRLLPRKRTMLIPHRATLAFKAIRSRPQPTASSALIKENGGECPCYRRRFGGG
jgi:hypothetical protein